MKNTWISIESYITRFHRDFYADTDEFTFIAMASWGQSLRSGLHQGKNRFAFLEHPFTPIVVQIPRLTVITTSSSICL